MIVPTLCLNGTSAEQLVHDQLQVIHHLQAAQRALLEAAPHRRDYQTAADPLAHETARAEHVERLAVLESLTNELIALAEAIHFQAAQRRIHQSFAETKSGLMPISEALRIDDEAAPRELLNL